MKNKKKLEKSKKKVKLKLVEPKQTLGQKVSLRDETVHGSIAILLIFVAIFLIAGAFQKAGSVGDFLYKNLSDVMGIGYYLLPLSAIIFAISFFKNIDKQFTKIKAFGFALFIISGLGFIELVFSQEGGYAGGGYIGAILAKTENYLGAPMAVVLSLIILIISQIIIFDGIPKIKSSKNKEELPFTENLSENEENKVFNNLNSTTEKPTQKLFTVGRNPNNIGDTKEKKEEKKIFKISAFEKNNSEKEGNSMTEKITENKNFSNKDVILPPISLLSKDKGKINAGDVKDRANIIKSTLFSFGISVEIEAVSVGPTVTRYSLRPAIGVKVSKIAALNDDLALALAAKSIIIQTPIPGQSLVGIEIPNKNTALVGAGSLFSSNRFQNSAFDLPLAIGKDIAGEATIIGMEKTPHMLIAGATGAGKSVTVHAIINSMLFRHGPDSLKFILIDPKRVEMTLYEGIPHLLTPVIKDPKKAILSLRWAVNEMERRYEVLEGCHLQNITSYHSNVLQKARQNKEKEGDNFSGEMPEAMPYIVIVIDELADIMQQYPKELESGIVSIAQKARAVGIHLILSTQRPSVNVVTGLIKANIPTRIALQVSSAIDSKTILDQGGAEKLLGKGDMLYMTGSMAKPVRVQSSFISENEIKSVVKFIKKAYKDILGEEITLGNDEQKAQEVSTFNSDIQFNDEDFDADPMLKDAIDEVMNSGKASTSYLQRKLGIGYARAAKLIDIMEEKNIIGPPNGSKPREVLIKEEE